MIDDKIVGFVRDNDAIAYPSKSPYHPSKRYPEAPFPDIQEEENRVYDLVRELFNIMGLDSSNYGNPHWNPLGRYIHKGNKVILKPNLVSHINYAFKIGITDTDCLVTHGSVIRAVADFVIKALDGEGEIIVGDCPIQATKWEEALKITGLVEIQQYYQSKGIRFRTRDYRLIVAQMEGSYVGEKKLQNNLEDYIEVDLAQESLLMPIIHYADRFAVSDYDFKRIRRVHNNETNKYLIPREVLEADCFINIPKLKLHVKAGITVALKNLVGIIGHKDYLPHFRIGSGRKGYDEYPHRDVFEPIYWGVHHIMWQMKNGILKRFLFQFSRLFNLFISWERRWEGAGGWYGNDTLWRTILDINRALLYYDLKTEKLSDKKQCNYFAIVDGIIGGDHEGPLAPRPVKSGCLIAGTNPAAVDLISAASMAINYLRVPSVAQAFSQFRYPITDFQPNDVIVRSTEGEMSLEKFARRSDHIQFIPSSGWKGKIEIEK